MATPADQRLLELLDKWLASLDLHVKYAALDDERYRRVQPWVEHQRPSRWIIDVARQKTLALKAQVEARIASGDEGFAESLELMIFLANLVGSEHIERFIPLAEPASERPLTEDSSPTIAAPQAAAPADSATGTREMPQYLVTRERPRPPSPAQSAPVARAERKPGAGRPRTRPPAEGAAEQPPAPAPTAKVDEGARRQVLADAERLLQWGRKWYELPELIARMADRPALPEVRRILKEHKPQVDRKSGR
ncbi:MAG: hypothetical protein KGL34_06370 [Gammaproteobacteria bacterium]|nr:hypothetical protein [Gammaproteobacteria bacterium]